MAPPEKKGGDKADQAKADEKMWQNYISMIKGYPGSQPKKKEKPKAKKEESRMEIWNRSREAAKASREKACSNVESAITLRDRCLWANKHKLWDRFMPKEPEPEKKNVPKFRRKTKTKRKPPVPVMKRKNKSKSSSSSQR
mmetsp:Transcript_25075/g.49355  ORF Transcript_25075/g.49355 Transcript_25075/m.49355 type:complete len:140 (+) Transcript_25075:86-505(+)